MTNFDIFDAYRRANTENQADTDYCDIDHLLRFWREAKGKDLLPMFGDQLILEQPIVYEKTQDELAYDVAAMLEKHYRELNNMLDIFYCALEADTAKIHLFGELIYQEFIWTDDVIQEPPFVLKFKNGQSLQVQTGQKFTRLWGKIAKIIGTEDIWEHLRIEHSRIFNDRRIKGTLCLSIHPMDYATASDNANNWSSCMSWENNGCYRMGTVEMMNSPMVVCAYVKSDKQFFEFGSDWKWNSKKWRAWLIVTPQMIICNKQYPYYNEPIAKQALDWMRTLAQNHYHSNYGFIHENFLNHLSFNNIKVNFTTNFMYNDLYATPDILGISAIQVPETAFNTIDLGTINISGVAECMICGDVIPVDESDKADALECANCHSDLFCQECGCLLSEDVVIYGPRGEIWCSDCWNANCVTCTCCGDDVYRDTAENVVMPIFPEVAKDQLTNHCDNEDFKNEFLDCWGDLKIPIVQPEEDNYVCLHCLEKYHPIVYTMRRSYPDHQFATSRDIVTVDPRVVLRPEAFDLFRPAYYRLAHSWFGKKYKVVRTFWESQWDEFKKEIETHPDRFYSL